MYVCMKPVCRRAFAKLLRASWNPCRGALQRPDTEGSLLSSYGLWTYRLGFTKPINRRGFTKPFRVGFVHTYAHFSLFSYGHRNATERWLAKPLGASLSSYIEEALQSSNGFMKPLYTKGSTKIFIEGFIHTFQSFSNRYGVALQSPYREEASWSAYGEGVLQTPYSKGTSWKYLWDLH